MSYGSNSSRIGMARQKVRFVEGGGFDRGYNQGGKGNKKKVDHNKEARYNANRQRRNDEYGDYGY